MKLHCLFVGNIDIEYFIGRIINGYKLVQHLGTGGFGIVFKAIHNFPKNEFAVKISHQIISGKENVDQIIRDGLNNLKYLIHPNIIKTYDVGRTRNKWSKASIYYHEIHQRW